MKVRGGGIDGGGGGGRRAAGGGREREGRIVHERVQAGCGSGQGHGTRLLLTQRGEVVIMVFEVHSVAVEVHMRARRGSLALVRPPAQLLTCLVAQVTLLHPGSRLGTLFEHTRSRSRSRSLPRSLS